MTDTPAPPEISSWPVSPLAWATAPLGLLSLPERVVFADSMKSISRPRTLLKQRAVRTFWYAVAEYHRVALVIEEEGETSDLLEELAHHKRRAVSAIMAGPNLTLGDLYPVPMSALAHTGNPPPSRLQATETSTPADVGCPGFQSERDSAEFRNTSPNRSAPANPEKTRASGKAGKLASKSRRRPFSTFRSNRNSIPKREG